MLFLLPQVTYKWPGQQPFFVGQRPTIRHGMWGLGTAAQDYKMQTLVHLNSQAWIVKVLSAHCVYKTTSDCVSQVTQACRPGQKYALCVALPDLQQLCHWWSLSSSSFHLEGLLSGLQQSATKVNELKWEHILVLPSWIVSITIIII